MAMQVTNVNVWAGDVPDQAGGLAAVLEALSNAGADLECVIGRRRSDRPGAGVVYVTPIKGKKAEAAAMSAGLMPAKNIATLRVEGADKAGLGSRIMRAVADQGINVRGISAAVQGSKFVAYLGFDSADDAAKATRAIKSINGKRATATTRPRAVTGMPRQRRPRAATR